MILCVMNAVQIGVLLDSSAHKLRNDKQTDSLFHLFVQDGGLQSNSLGALVTIQSQGVLVAIIADCASAVSIKAFMERGQSD